MKEKEEDDTANDVYRYILKKIRIRRKKRIRQERASTDTDKPRQSPTRALGKEVKAVKRGYDSAVGETHD